MNVRSQRLMMAMRVSSHIIAVTIASSREAMKIFGVDRRRPSLDWSGCCGLVYGATG